MKNMYKLFVLDVYKSAGGIGYVYVPTKEEFISRLKTDDEFAKKWES